MITPAAEAAAENTGSSYLPSLSNQAFTYKGDLTYTIKTMR